MGGGVKFFLNSFRFFFFWSFIGDYVFQCDLQHPATRLDHRASEREERGKKEIEK